MSKKNREIAILGAGNIGTAIASGLSQSSNFKAGNITLTRRKVEYLDSYKKEGFKVQSDNISAVKNADIILIAVEPQQMDALLNEIKEAIDEQRHFLISVVSG
ncbi:MAG: pyrroline-5-carboxylate reductase family protein, partial [Candidatus Cyclobacteriaceae bacterium M2_1C_046]